MYTEGLESTHLQAEQTYWSDGLTKYAQILVFFLFPKHLGKNYPEDRKPRYSEKFHALTVCVEHPDKDAA